MQNPVRDAARGLARALARVNVVDAERGERTADLAWPRTLTGLARMSQRTADFAMVGVVLGPAALAGMAFALAFWQIGNTLALGLAGGTIGQVSRLFGADDHRGIDLAVKGSIWVGLALAVPVTLTFALAPTRVVALFGSSAATTAYGATYLRIAALGVPFAFVNKVASRSLVGADDARIPMLLRGGGAVVNLLLNVVLVFGLGLGVAGAALGTLAATILVALTFVAGMTIGWLPVAGEFPIEVHVGPPYADRDQMRRLVVESAPLMGRRLSTTLARFPLLAIAATFGPVVVAAFEVARRVRSLVMTPNWGFSLAASSLVGQALGDGDGDEATAYGWDVLRFSLVVHAALVVAVFAAARPIAGVFVDEPGHLARTTPFVRVTAVSALGLAVDGVATGVLRGSGDTRWPLYGKLLGLYCVTIPVAYAGVVTPLGVVGLYAALATETVVPAAVCLYRFHSGAWLRLHRRESAGGG